MAEEEVLLEELSPHGTMEAFVCQDDRVAVFYLRGTESGQYGIKSCWVRNLRPAPQAIELSDLEGGRAPMLPAEFCRHPGGALPLRADALRVVWFEEGDAAALFDGDGVLAIIPGWSGKGGCDGYARDCIGQAPFCWELEKDNVLFDRIRRSEKYWDAWSQPEGPWEATQKGQCDAYERNLGKYKNYYAIDGDNWPPKAMLRTERADAVFLTTVGVGLRAQPKVEQYGEIAANWKRIELGAAQSPAFAAHNFMPFAKYLSGQSGFPWSELTWLGPHHTIPCNAFTPDSPFRAVLLVASAFDLPAISLPACFGEPVHILWMVPITEAERLFAMERGGEALAGKLAAAGVGAVAAERPSVV